MTAPDAYWTLKQAAIRQHMVTDPMTRFPEWSTIMATMFVGPCGMVEAEFNELLQARRLPVISELGSYPNSNLFHQAYHIYQWEKNTGRRVGDLARIVEIGGGYGAMARVCRGLGFAGEYVIYDLPALSELQRYYLRETGTQAECHGEFVSDRGDLLIALYSLSEMSLTTQARYLAGVTARHWLIGTHDALWWDVDTNTPLNAHFASGQRVKHLYFDGLFYLVG